MKIVAASGYFDPIHVGHIEYLEKSRELGDKLIVIVNNDTQTKLKKGFVFMPQEDRLKIVKALKCVDEVFLSIDTNKIGIHVPVCKSLEAVKPDIFAKGGDRTIDEIPETPICNKLNIKVIDGLGKKIRSSSDIVGSVKKNE